MAGLVKHKLNGFKCFSEVSTRYLLVIQMFLASLRSIWGLKGFKRSRIWAFFFVLDTDWCFWAYIESHLNVSPRCLFGTGMFITIHGTFWDPFGLCRNFKRAQIWVILTFLPLMGCYGLTWRATIYLMHLNGSLRCPTDTSTTLCF